MIIKLKFPILSKRDPFLLEVKHKQNLMQNNFNQGFTRSEALFPFD